MITGTATRLAGKALAEFLKVATSATSAAVEKKVLGKLADVATDAPGLLGAAARHPETVAKLAGAAAPVAAAGGVAAGAGLIGKIFQDPENIYSQSQYTLPMRKAGTAVSYANQQYVPGDSPLTNQTAAEAMLEQQKFQHQLQLIDARQAAQQSVGIGGRTTGGGLDIMGLSQQVFAPTQY